MDSLNLTEPDIEFGIGIRDEETGEYQPRISNMGKIQRTTITGFDRREPMVVYGRRDTTLHGTDSNGKPCSLIVFCWYLHERQRGKRFQSLRITVSFATARVQSGSAAIRVPFYDPHVRAVAPHGTFSLLPAITAVEKKDVDRGVPRCRLRRPDGWRQGRVRADAVGRGDAQHRH